MRVTFLSAFRLSSADTEVIEADHTADIAGMREIAVEAQQEEMVDIAVGMMGIADFSLPAV